MKAYLDAGFVLTLVVNTRGIAEATRTLSDFPAPYQINLLHQLQVETFFREVAGEAREDLQKGASKAEQNWFRYIQEAIFHVSDADWTQAFGQAIGWARDEKIAPTPPLLNFHVAIAKVGGFTHFLSFDPRARAIANLAGMKVLPERL